MPNKDMQKPTEGRTHYQSPLVVRVSLRPEEAVLGHCKVTGSTGPVGLSGSCRTPVACNSQGS